MVGSVTLEKVANMASVADIGSFKEDRWADLWRRALLKCELAAISQLGKDPLLFAMFSVEEEEKVVALVLIG